MTAAALTLFIPDAGAAVALRTAAQAGSEPKFIVGTAPPGRAPAVTGYCIDLFRAIEQVDPTIRIVGDQTLMTPASMKHMMDTNDLDLACAWVHAGRHGDGYTFVEPALFTFRFVLAARVGDNAAVQNWDDVHKLAPDNVVLINHDWAQADWVQPLQGLRIDSAGYSSQSNLTKLAASRGRFFFFREPGLSLEIAAAGLQDKVHVLPAQLGSDPAFLVLRKNLPEAEHAELQSALMQLEARGELARLNSRWSLAGTAPLQAHN
jgi:hypothetical protein